MKVRVPRLRSDWYRNPWLVLLVAGLVLGTGFAVVRIVTEVRATRAFRAATAALQAGDPETARAKLAYCQSVWPDSAEVAYQAARAARLTGNLREADERLRRAKELGWVPEAISFEAALLRAARGDLSIENYLRAAVDSNHPEKAAALEALAVSYYVNFQLGQAFAAIDQWIKEQPGRAEAWLLKGRVSERMRNRSEALEAYREAHRLAPDKPEVREALAFRLLESNQGAEAVEHFEWLHARRPSDAVVRLGLARALTLIGQADRARPLLDQLVRDEPTSSDVLAARAYLEKESREFAAAEKWYREAIKHPPVDNDVYYNFALCLQQVGKTDEYQKTIAEHKRREADQKELASVTQRVAQSPRDPEPRWQAGVILLRNGVEHEAVRWLESALAEDRLHGPTHETLAKYYADQKDETRATLHRTMAQQAASLKKR